MPNPKLDTIAAVSTAAGRAAISIVRVSGPEAFEIIKKIFKTGGKKAFPLPYSAYYGTIYDSETEQMADKVVITCYLAPHSYTGENIAEICTHGNPVIVSNVMRLLLKNGARQAEAGEFTKRAFLNGKMDLLEVEAVSQLLYANTAIQADIALKQLDGLPSKFVSKIRECILNHLVQLEASLNFPEDAIESIDEETVKKDLISILEELRIFTINARNGSIIAEGLKIALLGRPNSGKSSLMNYMLGRDRAIVTDIAGTTRDTLEENIVIGNLPVRLIDTAGMRKPGDAIEKIGIERTQKACEDAFMIIGVFDGSEKANNEDRLVLEFLRNQKKPVLVVFNKNDLPQNIDKTDFDGLESVSLSALQGNGLVDLNEKISAVLKKYGIASYENMVLLGAKQFSALEKAEKALQRATDGIGTYYQDMLAIDLEESVRELGKINGETVDVNTLDLVFERFCIGK